MHAFVRFRAGGEGRILTADGSPVYVRLYKKDAVDTDGTPIWIMSVQMNWAYENLALVNESIHSALWYLSVMKREIVHVNWSMRSGRSLDIMTFWIFRTNWIRGRTFCTRRIMTG